MRYSSIYKQPTLTVTCAEFSHNFQYPIDEFVKLLVGPHSQFKPMLNKLQAAGNSNIYQQAAQVKMALQSIESLLRVALICLAFACMLN